MTKKILANLLSNEGSLQQKTIKSGFWSLASRFSTRGLDLIKFVIVARLLNPNDFGLLGIALLTLAVFQVFTQTGFKESIIQNKNNIKGHLNTAWTTLIIRGIFLYIIVFISAPFISMFFAEPRAELIIQVMGITLILEGMQNIAIVLLHKELEFQKRFLLDLGRTLPSFILTVSLAFIIKNVWALVYGSLIGGVGMLFISYSVHPYRPKLEFNKEKAKEMFGFGKWVLGESIVVFIATQGDDIFLGKVLGVYALGFYTLAFQISNTPATEITHVISQVTFPVYSKLQDNINSFKKGFERTLQLTIALSIILGTAIFIFIPEFTTYILGKQWIPIIWPIRILAVSGILRSITAIWGPLYYSKGIPKYAFWKNVLRVIATFTPIYPLTFLYGISGTSLSVLIGVIFCIIFDILFMILKKPFQIYLRNILKYLIGIFISLFISIIFYISILCYINSLSTFLIGITTTTIVFIILMILTEKYRLNRFFTDVKNIF